MAISALAQALIVHPLFRGLKPLQITEIVRRAGRIIYKPGSIIVREGDAADASVIIIEGDAAWASSQAMIAEADSVPPGSLLGEMAMLIETTYSTTVVARGTVRALRISREDIHDIMMEDAGIADHFLRCISGRLSLVLQELKGVDQAIESSISHLPRTSRLADDVAPVSIH